MLTFFLLLPFYTSLLFILYLFVKRKTIDDEYFDVIDTRDLSRIKEKIRTLATINWELPQQEIEKVEKLYVAAEKRHFAPVFENKLYDQLIAIYFKEFNSRWAAFYKADIVQKCVLLLMMLQGFIYFIILICHVSLEKGFSLSIALPGAIILSLVFFVVPLIFSFMLIAFLSVMLSVLLFIFPRNGKIKRASVILDEFVRSLKPGGRDTPLIDDIEVSGFD